MRIISKFQDYYDSALAYGFENDRVYVRQNQAWNLRSKPLPQMTPLLTKLHECAKQAPELYWWGDMGYRNKSRPRDEHLQVSPVVFCVGGIVYKAAWLLYVTSKRLNATPWRYQEEMLIPSVEICDNTREEKTFIECHGDQVHYNGPIFDSAEYESILEPWMRGAQHLKNVYGVREELKIGRWLEQSAPNLYSSALAEGVALAMATRQHAAVNPRLVDWKFGRKMDAATMMQELSMFVGNMSMSSEPPVAIEDKHRITSHGFDEKSFRKQPTKHGLPKRAKRPHPDSPAG